MRAERAQSASSDGLQVYAPELWEAPQRFQPREVIARSSQEPNVFVVQKGWVARVRLQRSGRRTILELVLPGEHSPLETNSAATFDIYVALCSCQLRFASTQEALKAMRSSPTFARQVSIYEVRRRAIFEERVVSLGQRSALQRMAHFICELHTRLQGCSEMKDGMFPLTQTDVSELLGLSVVHTNRVIQKLRRDGLIEQSRNFLRVIDFPALANLAGFSNDYLM